ncbi:MAG: SAVED domain-containing protein [Patescibacteria group bacterium]|nr:SAVED domain-containing protein [Patescibacteria group bacterium]
MEILKHFEINKENDFIIFSLKDEEWETFINILPSEYKDCFISKTDLESRIKTLSSTKEKELSEILPTEGNIKSGDFGEILTFFLFKEIYKKQQIDGPKKWRWKQDQNMPAPYSDVILFSIKNNDKYSKDDLIISAESKMKATKDKRRHPIQLSIDGAIRDHTSRIAKSLSWLRKKYKDEIVNENSEKDKLVQLVKNINRFIESEKPEHGEYVKKVKAIAFVEKDFLADEKVKTINVPDEAGLDLEIYIVSIKDLQKMYETVFSEIPKI